MITMKYDVGQIIYLLGREKNNVFPSQVIEKVTRKNLEGEATSYIVKLPNKEKTEIELDKLNVDIFTSLATLREKMLNDSKLAIEKIIQNANDLSGNSFENLSDDSEEGLSENDNDSLINPSDIDNKMETGD